MSRHLGLVAEYVAAPAATWQDIQPQPRGVGVCARGTEARDEGLGARARHLCAQGEHTGAEALATSPSTSTSPRPSATGSPRSRLKPLGQPGAKANGGVGARLAVASWQGGGLGRAIHMAPRVQIRRAA